MVIIMGMKFNSEDEVPDFGSICLVSSESMAVKHYRLSDEDVSKLDLLINASNGSDAFTDKGRLLMKLSGVWKEVQKGSGSSGEYTQTSYQQLYKGTAQTVSSKIYAISETEEE